MKVEKYRVLGELIETNKRQFVIPVYQRNYDWEKSHCKKLFNYSFSIPYPPPTKTLFEPLWFE